MPASGVVRIHHLNLCTMCPYGGRLISGADAPFWTAGTLVTHVLLLELRDRLVLVDSGMGIEDVRDPARRLGRAFVAMIRPELREEDTAAWHVERLGFSRSDVRDIVLTHLDPDHAGGLADFPHATVHTHRAEHAAAMQPPTLTERLRYRKVQLAHGPRWALHEAGGERWLGFDSVRAVADDVLLIPLRGHTRGHSAVAVRAPEGSGVEYYLHAGDAYFHHGELVDPRDCPAMLRGFQARLAPDDEARRTNAGRLRELHSGEHGKRVRIFSAHCPTEFRRAIEEWT